MVSKGYEPEYLLFAIKYCLDNGWKIKYPAGLYYAAKDEGAMAAWKKKKTVAVRKIQKDIKIEDNETSFQYIPKTNRGFEDILH